MVFSGFIDKFYQIYWGIVNFYLIFANNFCPLRLITLKNTRELSPGGREDRSCPQISGVFRCDLPFYSLKGFLSIVMISFSSQGVFTHNVGLQFSISNGVLVQIFGRQNIYWGTFHGLPVDTSGQFEACWRAW